ncbi:SNF2 family N-terminal domain-containing protein [Bisporella sp. PMI_857]|nr:SNF2 family N-terminal domain-containing protein [Bisporella sp. PMI_857]
MRYRKCWLALRRESQSPKGGTVSSELPIHGHRLKLEDFAPLPDLANTSDFHLAGIPSCSLTVGAGSQKDEEICLGMLGEVKIKINSNQNEGSKVLEQIEGDQQDTFAYLDMVFVQDRCDIQFKGTNFATMNTMTHRALTYLPSKEKVRYKALVPRTEFKQKLYAITQSLSVDVSQLVWSMDIHMFGVRSTADTVAKGLSKYRLFLQHPSPMPFDIPYENPQYFGKVGSSFTNGFILPPISAGPSQGPAELHPSSEDLDHRIDEVMAVINDLPRQDYGREVDVDKRIRTDLMSHQNEAVNFVRSRESIDDKARRMLWEVDELSSDGPNLKTRYTHKITGSRSKTPDDILGGILADYMGLGKTLTVIATIVASIPRAGHFAARKYLNDEGTKAAIIPVMSTLVIVPSAMLLNGWIAEVEKHVVPGTLKHYTYHGPSRHLGSSSPLPYHIVFSTYGTVVADANRGGGVLKCFHWYRLILDEAHIIRNSSTKQFKAVTNLSANIRWCMTGTPVQNSLEDLGSLIKFLRVPLLSDTGAFRRRIGRKQRIEGNTQRSKPDYKNLKLLLGSICLRRSILTLSLGVTCLEKQIQLSDTEKTAYEHLQQSCKQSIDTVVNNRRASRANRALLTAILRLRIFCNTGLTSMGISESNSMEQFHPDEINSLYQQSGEDVCVECNSNILSFNSKDGSVEQLNNPRRRLKCRECIPEIASLHEGGNSFEDRQDLAQNIDRQHRLLQREDSGNEYDSDRGSRISDRCTYPSKLKALLSDITEHYFHDKSIVFSFWKRSLDLTAQFLRENGISFHQVDGNLSLHQRQKILAQFHDDPSLRVLLMTLGTGAVGLNNLSVASRVHILEPQWNPSMEDQAIGRVLRLGQNKKVCIVRYIMSGTIEEASWTNHS